MAGLAIVGFIAAALTLHQDHMASEAAERHLRYQNDVLKALILSNKRVSPLVRIVIGTDSPLDTTPANAELTQWMKGGAMAAQPKPIGFVPSLVRAEIFRGAQPRTVLTTENEAIAVPPALQSLGYVDLRASEDRLRFQFSVGTDGSALWARPGARLQRLETSVFELPNRKRAVVFEFTVSDPLEALELFHSFDRSYEQGSSLLVLRVATPSCSARDVQGQERMARVSAADSDAPGRRGIQVTIQAYTSAPAPFAAISTAYSDPHLTAANGGFRVTRIELRQIASQASVQIWRRSSSEVRQSTLGVRDTTTPRCRDRDCSTNCRPDPPFAIQAAP